LEAQMKNPLKNQKGISLLALIITIIVIIILAGIALTTGINNNVENTVKAKLAQEYGEVKELVTQRGKEHRLSSETYSYNNLIKDYFYGVPGESGDKTEVIDGITYSNGSTHHNVLVNNIVYSDGYYLLDEDSFDRMGLSGVTHKYIANFETGDVILAEPVIIGDSVVYTLDDLLSKTTGNDNLGVEKYNEEKKVNAPVLFVGMIPVKIESGKWVVTKEDDPEWYDYTISNNGPIRYANVMLLDGLELEEDGSSNIINNEKVRTMTRESMVGKYVHSKGSMFIWIPRYTYKGTEIVYSKLTQDYTYNGFVKSPAFYKGEYQGGTPNNDNGGYIAGGKELTGYWISKYQAGYTG